MLPELLRSLTLHAPPWAHRLGLVHEHVAITFRRKRTKTAWAPHLAASKAAILSAARRCRTRRRALVIGAGDCADVPVSELAARFDEVVLTDAVLGPEMRRHARKSRGKIRAEIWDATGALTSLAAESHALGPDAAEAVFANADAGPPPGGEPDLVVSANCISQLGVVPLDRFAHVDENRCAAAAARRHLHWLSKRAGIRVLLADRVRIDLSETGAELRREHTPGMNGLRQPNELWRWDLAPIPELSREFHRIHEVGAWIDGPG